MGHGGAAPPTPLSPHRMPTDPAGKVLISLIRTTCWASAGVKSLGRQEHAVGVYRQQRPLARFAGRGLPSGKCAGRVDRHQGFDHRHRLAVRQVYRHAAGYRFDTRLTLATQGCSENAGDSQRQLRIERRERGIQDPPSRITSAFRSA